MSLDVVESLMLKPNNPPNQSDLTLLESGSGRFHENNADINNTDETEENEIEEYPEWSSLTKGAQKNIKQAKLAKQKIKRAKLAQLMTREFGVDGGGNNDFLFGRQIVLESFVFNRESGRNLIATMERKINSKIVRMEDVYLFRQLIDQCSSSVFCTNAVNWSQMMFNIFKSGFSADILEEACLCCHRLMHHVILYPEVQHTYAVSFIPSLLDLIIGSHNLWEIPAVFFCLSRCIKYFPKSCGPYQNKILMLCLSKLFSHEVSMKLIEEIGFCLAMTCFCGPESRHKASWNSLTNFLFRLMQNVTNEIIEYDDKFDVLENHPTEIQFKLASIPEFHASRTSNLVVRYQKICQIFLSLFRCDVESIIDFPLTVCLQILLRMLSDCFQLQQEYKNMELKTFMSALPVFQQMTLQCLNKLFSMRTLLLPFTFEINQMYVSVLQWATGNQQTNRKLILAILISQCEWIEALGSGCGFELILQSVFPILKKYSSPIQQTTSADQSHLPEQKKRKKKVRNKMGYTNLAQHSLQEKHNSELEEELCAASLKVLCCLVENCSVLIEPKLFKDVQEHCASTLFEIQTVEPKSPFVTGESRAGLCALAETLCRCHHTQVAPITHVALQFLRSALHDECPVVRSVSRKAISSLEFLMHPRRIVASNKDHVDVTEDFGENIENNWLQMTNIKLLELDHGKNMMTESCQKESSSKGMSLEGKDNEFVAEDLMEESDDSKEEERESVEEIEEFVSESEVLEEMKNSSKRKVGEQEVKKKEETHKRKRRESKSDLESSSDGEENGITTIDRNKTDKSKSKMKRLRERKKNKISVKDRSDSKNFNKDDKNEETKIEDITSIGGRIRDGVDKLPEMKKSEDGHEADHASENEFSPIGVSTSITIDQSESSVLFRPKNDDDTSCTSNRKADICTFIDLFNEKNDLKSKSGPLNQCDDKSDEDVVEVNDVLKGNEMIEVTDSSEGNNVRKKESSKFGETKDVLKAIDVKDKNLKRKVDEEHEMKDVCEVNDVQEVIDSPGNSGTVVDQVEIQEQPSNRDVDQLETAVSIMEKSKLASIEVISLYSQDEESPSESEKCANSSSPTSSSSASPGAQKLQRISDEIDGQEQSCNSTSNEIIINEDENDDDVLEISPESEHGPPSKELLQMITTFQP